ncbi:hypothetical protein C8A01DRAFT_38222 [Parachaetomium inaequale]|uniref:Uncharacterized protein n=1 Tax=Parachaetomium inaequale TaxID=2588326 RepID=A0AAN6SNW0_9PEZI|nr:hypothetical protein C8A01DRAFT_38222 [Parachaetomium inaequale]
MTDPGTQPTHSGLLAPQEPWLKYDGFNNCEWLIKEPLAMEWVDKVQELGLAPPDLPKFPFFIFGPVELVERARNIGASALDGALSTCRAALADPTTQHQGIEHHEVLAWSLSKSSQHFRSILKEARERHIKQGIQLDMEDTLPEVVELTDLNTLDKLEEFVRNPENLGVVSFAAILLGLNWCRACRSPGTVLFLEDVQRMALEQPGAGNGYCAAVPVRHSALNAGALLIALNFYHFDRLKMVPANIDENCSRWSGSPELVKLRNQVMHELHATGRGVLVRELIRCRFAVEKWFQNAPRPLETADIPGTGVVAHDLHMLLQGNTTQPEAQTEAEQSATVDVVEEEEPETDKEPETEKAERRKAKKAVKNKRRKEPKRQRQAVQQASTGLSTTAPVTNMEAGAVIEAGVPGSSEAPDDNASELSAEDGNKHDEKMRRKAKGQRRKERRRLEREAKEEKKRAQGEASSRAREERRRQEEERRKKEHERQFEENRRRWEEPRRRQQENEARLAKKVRLAEEARPVDEARMAETTEAHSTKASRRSETRPISEAAEAHRVGQDEVAHLAEEERAARLVEAADTLSGKGAEGSGGQKARIAKEHEIRPAEEVRIAEDAHRAEVRRGKEPQRAKHGRRAREAEEDRSKKAEEVRAKPKWHRNWREFLERAHEQEQAYKELGEAISQLEEGYARAEEAWRRIRAGHASFHEARQALHAFQLSQAYGFFPVMMPAHASQHSQQLQSSEQFQPVQLAQTAQPAPDLPPAQGLQHAHTAQPMPIFHHQPDYAFQHAQPAPPIPVPKLQAEPGFYNAQEPQAVHAPVPAQHHQPAYAFQQNPFILQPAEQPVHAQSQHVPGSEELQTTTTSALQNPIEPAANWDSGVRADNSTPEPAIKQGVWDPESLYNRVPRNLAHSRARSVDRGEFA